MRKAIFTSLVYALLMVFAQICYFNVNWIFTPEDAFVSKLDRIGELIKRRDHPPDLKFLFINTGYNNSLAEVESPSGDSGTLAITNRDYCTRLLKRLADFGNHHRYILWDIRYDISTPDDSSLRCQFARVNRIIMPRNQERDSLLNFGKRAGFADYRSYGGHLSRMSLFDPGEGKSLPYSMYEEFNQVQSKFYASGLVVKNSYSPTTVFPHFFIRKDDKVFQEISLHRICEMLEMRDYTVYDDFVRDKILVVGNFVDDQHVTRVGIMPGSLILLNTFLTLQSGLHLIRFPWVLFMVMFFASLVYLEVYVRPQTNQKFSRWYLLRRILEPGVAAGFICFLSLLFFGMPFSISGTLLSLHIIFYLENK